MSGAPLLEAALTSPAVAAPPRPAAARWLHVMSHTEPRYGGLSAAVPALAASLAAQAGVDVSLAAFCQPTEQYCPAALTPAQVHFWPVARTAWLLGSALRARFAETVRAAQGLHVHGLWEESTAAACRAARAAGKPYVLSAHGMLEPWALAAKGWKKRLYATLLERANVGGAGCLHALTAAEAGQYRRFGAKGPIAVIPNAVELPATADPALFLDRFPELSGRRVVLFLSRFHEKKGLDLLVDAWAPVARAHREAHLALAGPDADGMAAPLQQRCQALGIAAQVSFPGMLAGTLKWSALAAAEAFVLPSHSEGLSMALLEALGMGLPVIATRACNLPEITHTGAGWEIEPEVEPLTEALHVLLSQSPDDNRAMGQRGAALVRTRYTQAQVTAQMAEVYDFLLGGPLPAHVALFEGGAR